MRATTGELRPQNHFQEAMFAHSENTLASHAIIVCVYACTVGCYEFAGSYSRGHRKVPLPLPLCATIFTVSVSFPFLI